MFGLDLENILFQTAGEFSPAPNPLIHDPDTGETKRLLDVARRSPTVRSAVAWVRTPGV